MSINIRTEVLKFVDDDTASGYAKIALIDKLVRCADSVRIWYQDDKSPEWNIVYLNDILSCESETDCGDYNHDVACLAVRLELEEQNN